MPRTALATALLVTLGCLTASAQDQAPDSTPATVWQASLPGAFKRMTLTALGAVLVETKGNGIVLQDPASGKVVWARPDGSDFKILWGTTSAVIMTSTGREVVDLATGATLWRFASLPIADPKGFLNLASGGLLLVYGPTPESSATVLGVAIDSGTVRWRQDTLFAARTLEPGKVRLGLHVSPIMTSDTSALIDADEAGLITLRITDGRPLWGIADSVINLDDPTLTMNVVAGDLLIAYKKKLSAFDVATGVPRWSRSDKFPGLVNRIFPTDRGLVVGGIWIGLKAKAFIDLIDPTTGTSIWSEPVEFKGRSPFVVRGDTIFTAADRAFVALELASSKVLVDAILPDFGGKEEATGIELFENGDFLLASSQNLMRVDPTGQMKYHRFLKAPGMSFLAKFATLAAVAAVGSAGYTLTPSGNRQAGSVFTRRFNATTTANRFAYIFTSQTESEDGVFYLARVDRTDGRETGRIRLYDRSPSYVLDPVSATIVVAAGSQLLAYRY